MGVWGDDVFLYNSTSGLVVDILSNIW
jgi:hypothetical protein